MDTGGYSVLPGPGGQEQFPISGLVGFAEDKKSVMFSYVSGRSHSVLLEKWINGWPLTFAEQVFIEYRKFLFLCAISPQPVTPSDAVDQAWHLHLSYTHSYWNDLCRNILGKDLHHNPTQGGASERNKFSDFYNYTLELYRSTFDSDPPVDIWPPETERFSDIDFVRVNKRTNWVLKKFRIPPSVIFTAGALLIFFVVRNLTVLFVYLLSPSPCM